MKNFSSPSNLGVIGNLGWTSLSYFFTIWVCARFKFPKQLLKLAAKFTGCYAFCFCKVQSGWICWTQQVCHLQRPLKVPIVHTFSASKHETVYINNWCLWKYFDIKKVKKSRYLKKNVEKLIYHDFLFHFLFSFSNLCFIVLDIWCDPWMQYNAY